MRHTAPTLLVLRTQVDYFRFLTHQAACRSWVERCIYGELCAVLLPCLRWRVASRVCRPNCCLFAGRYYEFCHKICTLPITSWSAVTVVVLLPPNQHLSHYLLPLKGTSPNHESGILAAAMQNLSYNWFFIRVTCDDYIPPRRMKGTHSTHHARPEVRVLYFCPHEVGLFVSASPHAVLCVLCVQQLCDAKLEQEKKSTIICLDPVLGREPALALDSLLHSNHWCRGTATFYCDSTAENRSNHWNHLSPLCICEPSKPSLILGLRKTV